MTAIFSAALRTALLATAFAAPGAFAAWTLDGERSTVQFISVKNASVAEVHHFKALRGGVSRPSKKACK